MLVTDWHVTIPATVTGLSFDFDSGDGDDVNTYLEVNIFDKCQHLDTGTPTSVGQFYPSSTVTGITVDASGVVNDPGTGNDIAYSFDFPGIDSNTDLYVDNGDDTATVTFCAQVGLFNNNDEKESYAEIKLIYDIDLTTNATTLDKYYLGQSQAHASVASSTVAFDGTLESYFCNPTTKVALPNDGSKTYQGDIIDVCFRVPDGQFEVKNVLHLNVWNNDAGESYLPSQGIVVNGVLQSGTSNEPYATETCTDVDGSDTNVCVVSLLLKQAFYDKPDFTLSGSGTVVLELGDASGSRRQMLANFALNNDQVEAIRENQRQRDLSFHPRSKQNFTLDPIHFEVIDPPRLGEEVLSDQESSSYRSSSESKRSFSWWMSLMAIVTYIFLLMEPPNL